MRHETYDSAGRLRERWDDTTRTYTAWDAAGVQTTSRPYNAAENARANDGTQEVTETTNKSSIQANLQADLAAMQAIIDQTNASLRTDPAPAIKAIARNNRRLTKMALRDFSTAE